jgi:hypothetical protein
MPKKKAQVEPVLGFIDPEEIRDLDGPYTANYKDHKDSLLKKIGLDLNDRVKFSVVFEAAYGYSRRPQAIIALQIKVSNISWKERDWFRRVTVKDGLLSLDEIKAKVLEANAKAEEFDQRKAQINAAEQQRNQALEKNRQALKELNIPERTYWRSIGSMKVTPSSTGKAKVELSLTLDPMLTAEFYSQMKLFLGSEIDTAPFE